MSKMSAYVETFKIKDGDEGKNNKIMSFRTDNEKLLEKHKFIWTMIEDLKILNETLYQSMMIDI